MSNDDFSFDDTDMHDSDEDDGNAPRVALNDHNPEDEDQSLDTPAIIGEDTPPYEDIADDQ